MTTPILIILTSAYVGLALIFGWVRAVAISLALAATAAFAWLAFAAACIL